MAITVGGTSITFNDATVQTTAFTGGTIRGGYTAVTLTSAAPNATLTAGSNQFIAILNDTTAPVYPSVTLPAMTSLPAGVEYFVFANMTPYNVALKDSGGVVREYLPPGANYELNIKDISTATGQWFTSFPVVAVEGDQRYTSILTTAFKVTQNRAATGTYVVPLTSTAFALVWAECTNGSTTVIYARLYTINTATKTFTVGNTITQYTASSLSTTIQISYDSDNAGHALVCSLFLIQGASYINYFGLSVSGGTLYASTNNTVNGPSPSGCAGAGGNILYVSYLGSNSAYALSFYLYETYTANGTLYVRGCTVTGTTTVTLTNSASNTTAGVSTNTDNAGYGARTSLNTFVYGAGGGLGARVGYAATYTSATNTFSVVTRTNQNRLDIEQGSTAGLSSFAQGGFMYSTNKVFFGINVFDVTNVGAAGVTTVTSTGFNYKANLSPNYYSFIGAGFTTTAVRTGIYVSGTSIIAIDSNGTRWQCDPSSTTLNLQSSTGFYGTARTGFTSLYGMLASDTGIVASYTSGAVGATMTVTATPVGIATPITA